MATDAFNDKTIEGGAAIASAEGGGVPLSIGGFPVVRVLGEGGMGRVFACRDEKLDRIVAIKVLRHDLAKVPSIVQRFLREAKAMAKIHSPQVAIVHTAGEEDEVPFLVMEMLEGEDLSARVQRKGQLEITESLTYTRDAVLGLAHAAEAGIIHRDVKPANLFLVDGRVKLTDFGLALPLDAGDARLTQEGLVVGTPHYLSPELARGGEADESSDIYSLGATFFELVTGAPPYPGEAALDVVSAHLHQPTPSLKKARADVPDTVHRLHQKMMAKKRNQRFSNYGELLEALDRVIDAVGGAYTPQQTDPMLRNPQVQSARVSQIRSRPSGAVPQITTATLTVLHLHVAGYTERIAQQSRDDSAHWLALHDELIQPLVRAFHGKHIKTIGDAMVMTFDSPTDGVLCGTAIQDRFFRHNAEALQDEQIHARVALSAGEVRVHKGDVLGEPMNLATRIDKLVTPGQVLLSDAVFSSMKHEGIPTESVGEHTFKGVRRGVIVYRVLPSEVPGELPFGGAALTRAEHSGGSLGAVGGGLSAGLSRINPMVALGVVGAFIAALLLALVIVRVLDPDMSSGSARDVVAEVSAVPLKARTGEQELRFGHAQRVLGDLDAGFAAYHRALKKGAHDELSLNAAIEQMEEERANAAVSYVGKWPDAAIEATLVEMLGSDWWARHNALLALEKRSVATDAQRTSVGVIDVLVGDTCGRRRYGLMILKRAGKGPQALAAINAARGRMPDNDCIADDLDKVERRVRGRG